MYISTNQHKPAWTNSTAITVYITGETRAERRVRFYFSWYRTNTLLANNGPLDRVLRSLWTIIEPMTVGTVACLRLFYTSYHRSTVTKKQWNTYTVYTGMRGNEKILPVLLLVWLTHYCLWTRFVLCGYAKLKIIDDTSVLFIFLPIICWRWKYDCLRLHILSAKFST